MDSALHLLKALFGVHNTLNPFIFLMVVRGAFMVEVGGGGWLSKCGVSIREFI